MASVKTFTVHEPPVAAADRIDRAEQLQFVKDGFSWPTAVFPPLGFALQRLWLSAVAYLAFVSALVAGLTAVGVDEEFSSLLILALNIYLGFELSTVQRFMLDSGGWQTIGSVSGKSVEDCERRFFEDWLPHQPAVIVGNPATRSSTRSFWQFGSRS